MKYLYSFCDIFLAFKLLYHTVSNDTTIKQEKVSKKKLNKRLCANVISYPRGGILNNNTILITKLSLKREKTKHLLCVNNKHLVIPQGIILQFFYAVAVISCGGGGGGIGGQSRDMTLRRILACLYSCLLKYCLNILSLS